MSSSLRASSERREDPAARLSRCPATSGASLSPLRRPAKTVNPSAANFLGDRGADEVARADHRRRGVSCCHLLSWP